MILHSNEIMPVIRSSLNRGQRVRLTVNGSSMIPFIHSGDIAKIEPLKKLRRGDIVLAEISDGRFVAHRIVKMQKNGLMLRGDAQKHIEGPISYQSVLGHLTSVRHKGHSRMLDRGFWGIAGLLWVLTNPLGPTLLYLCLPLWKLGKKAYRIVEKILK